MSEKNSTTQLTTVPQASNIAADQDGYPIERCSDCGGAHFVRRQEPGARWHCSGCTSTRGPDTFFSSRIETLSIPGGTGWAWVRPFKRPLERGPSS